VSSLDPRYLDVATNKQVAYELESYRENPSELFYFVSNDAVPLLAGRSYVLLNNTISASMPTLINSTVAIPPEMGVFFITNQELNKLVIEPQDQWVVFTIPRVPGWKLSVSLCYDSFASIDTKVNITGSHRSDEPSLGAWNASRKRFDTHAVRKQLGAILRTCGTNDNRGVMQLHNSPNDLRDQVRE
jgi:hypothetical protein